MYLHYTRFKVTSYIHWYSLRIRNHYLNDFIMFCQKSSVVTTKLRYSSICYILNREIFYIILERNKRNTGKYTFNFIWQEKKRNMTILNNVSDFFHSTMFINSDNNSTRQYINQINILKLNTDTSGVQRSQPLKVHLWKGYWLLYLDNMRENKTIKRGEGWNGAVSSFSKFLSTFVSFSLSLSPSPRVVFVCNLIGRDVPHVSVETSSY